MGSNKNKNVVVTGGGLCSPLGFTTDEAMATLKSLKNCVKKMTDWDKYQRMNTRLAAPVTRDLPQYPRKEIRSMGRVARLALVSCDAALKTAGLFGSQELKNGRAGIAYGSSMGSVKGLQELFGMLHPLVDEQINSTSYIRSMPQTCACNLEVRYGLTGRLLSVNTACTSSSQAIGFAYETIKSGSQDIMIAGGAEELSPATAAVFDTMFAASVKNDTPDLTPSPFDKDRDGLVAGEGSGTLILEEEQHAKARGAKIYAQIVGFATNTDGTHITQPNKDTIAKCLSLALEDATLCPQDIDYINAHGTATGAGDIAESLATYAVYGGETPISTIKSYTGHSLGACGAIEAWLSIIMAKEHWFCPNLNLKTVDPQCAPLDYITGQGRQLQAQYIVSNNFAFGGINTSLIFKIV